MNIEDLRKNLRELSGKQKDNLRKRKGLIREMKTLPYSQYCSIIMQTIKLQEDEIE